MNNKTTSFNHLTNQMGRFWRSHNSKIILLLLLSVFMAYTVFIAINLKPGIIPDEPAHFIFSKHYSSTWGIPPDVPETYSLGWYIYRNPFLYHWVNGRIINFLEFIKPNISNWQILVALRLVNVIFGLCTVVLCFLLSIEIIKHKWLSLLPVFLLTNTLMFVFLVGGVNYDNLANLFSMAGLFFFIRVLKNKKFITNSLGWTISIFTGTLVKFTILPLALFMGVIWIIYVIKNKEIIFPIVFSIKRDLFLGFLLLIIVLGNLVIYGYNLLTYQSITPDCMDILSTEQCRISPYAIRYQEFALDQKLTLTESINLGYPDPLSYLIDSWIPNVLFRIYGIAGHLAYWPNYIVITLYRLLLFWIVLLCFKYGGRPSFLIISSLLVFLFYTIVLFIMNYNSELIYGFRAITLQGRYFFPVIGLIYCLYAYLLLNIPNKKIFVFTFIGTIILFFIGGPINFIQQFDLFFIEWFLVR